MPAWPQPEPRIHASGVSPTQVCTARARASGEKRGDGDGRGSEALGCLGQEGSPDYPTLSLQAPVFLHRWSRVPGKVGNAARFGEDSPRCAQLQQLEVLMLVLLERWQTLSRTRAWDSGQMGGWNSELLPQMAVLSWP